MINVTRSITIEYIIVRFISGVEPILEIKNKVL